MPFCGRESILSIYSRMYQTVRGDGLKNISWDMRHGNITRVSAGGSTGLYGDSISTHSVYSRLSVCATEDTGIAGYTILPYITTYTYSYSVVLPLCC